MTLAPLWYRRLHGLNVWFLYHGRWWYPGSIGDFGSGPDGCFTHLFAFRRVKRRRA